MRLLVTSDSHGKQGNFFDAAELHIGDTDLFVNLGDSSSGEDLEAAKLFYKSRLRLCCVAGNCDFYSTEPYVKTIAFGEKKVLLCHGHTFYVKHGMERLIEEAKKQKADIALFGHTHNPFYLLHFQTLHLIFSWQTHHTGIPLHCQEYKNYSKKCHIAHGYMEY